MNLPYLFLDDQLFKSWKHKDNKHNKNFCRGYVQSYANSAWTFRELSHCKTIILPHKKSTILQYSILTENTMFSLTLNNIFHNEEAWLECIRKYYAGNILEDYNLSWTVFHASSFSGDVFLAVNYL